MARLLVALAASMLTLGASQPGCPSTASPLPTNFTGVGLTTVGFPATYTFESNQISWYSEDGMVSTACIVRSEAQSDGSVNVTTAIPGVDPAVVQWQSCWVLRFEQANSSVATPVVLQVHRTATRDPATGAPVCELSPRPRRLMAWNSPSVIRYNNSRCPVQDLPRHLWGSGVFRVPIYGAPGELDARNATVVPGGLAWVARSQGGVLPGSQTICLTNWTIAPPAVVGGLADVVVATFNLDDYGMCAWLRRVDNGTIAYQVTEYPVACPTTFANASVAGFQFLDAQFQPSPLPTPSSSRRPVTSGAAGGRALWTWLAGWAMAAVVMGLTASGRVGCSAR